MSKFEEIYKKVLDADKKFKELGIPINLDFKIEDFCDALIECNDKIEELKSIRKRLEDANEKLEKRNDEIYCEWKNLFEKYSQFKKELDAKNRTLFLSRFERNKFLASVTHCQGSMNWRNEKLQAKLFKRAAKLLQASEKCKDYAEKL